MSTLDVVTVVWFILLVLGTLYCLCLQEDCYSRLEKIFPDLTYRRFFLSLNGDSNYDKEEKIRKYTIINYHNYYKFTYNYLANSLLLFVIFLIIQIYLVE